MPYSFLSHLECSACGETYDARVPQNVCTCGKPLWVRYDLSAARRHWKTSDLEGRAPTLWRYHELLPVEQEDAVVSLGEGMTPLIPLPRLGSALKMVDLWLKDEGLLPTGSFKARGAAVGVARAHELGVTRIAMPTNGNAGAAWAIYAARAGMDACIVMPVDAPLITRNECAISGAHLYLVQGLISDAGRIVGQAVRDQGWFDVSTLKEPYRLEGKKTMGFELAEQLGWTVPDVIVYPTGGGVGLIGMYKAFRELQAIGFIAPHKMPRLVSVQASGCAPVVKAWEQGERVSQFWPQSETIAFGINVPKALGDFLILQALYDTDGCAVAVDDATILAAQGELARQEGIFACPEGAATVAAAQTLRQTGFIRETDKVVLLNTGAGIKYPDTVRVSPPVLASDATLPA